MTQHAPSRQPRLLIVDDEPVILQILKAVFEDEPYRLSLAQNGSEALAIMKRDGVDLLLTDKNLPDMNGLDLLRAAKASNQDSEVIIITGYASLETALVAMELEAFDYVLKPLNNVFDIRKKARRAIEKQRMTRENRALLDRLQKKNEDLERSLEETRKLQAALIQTEKLAGIGTLAAGIAHEISNPLFGILGLAEAIQEEDEPALVRGYAKEIVEYSQGIRGIVMELSGYSRAAKGEYLTTVDLSKVLEDALRLVGRSVDMDGVEALTDLEPGLQVHARTNEIQQVFVNLLKNAVEAFSERSEDALRQVMVRGGRGEDEVWIEVADTGPGIPQENRSLVFDPFFTTKRPGEGTGLGLNIVYRIVTRYRGTIEVGEAPEGGALFRLSFPWEE